MKPRKKIKQMVADQQTRSAGAQIPGGVGRSAQTDDDGCDIFAELLPPAAAIDHPTVDEWGCGGRRWGVGGMVWGGWVEFELPVLPSHTIPHLPPKMCQGVTVGNQFSCSSPALLNSFIREVKGN